MKKKKQIVGVFTVMFAMQTVFLYVPGDSLHTMFPLSEYKITYQGYFYYMFEHLAWIYAFNLLRNEIRGMRNEMNLLFTIQIVDLIDYLIHHNGTYFKFVAGGTSVDITFNVVQAFLYFYVWMTTKDE